MGFADGAGAAGDVAGAAWCGRCGAGGGPERHYQLFINPGGLPGLRDLLRMAIFPDCSGPMLEILHAA